MKKAATPRLLILILIAIALQGCARMTPMPTADNPVGLIILSPADGEIVNTPTIEIKGTAPQDTVITIGKEIIVVDETKEFALTLQIKEGENEIQILASDPEGNKAYKILIVDYEP